MSTTCCSTASSCAGVSANMLVAPVAVAQIIESISSIYSDPKKRPVGQVVAFVGAKGGSGSSTICHNTAFAIASVFKSDVVIADFDLPFGTAGLDFNQDPLQGIADALEAPERLDEVLLDRLLVTLLRSFEPVRRPRHARSIPTTLSRPPATRCSTSMRDNVPWIAVDVPHLWTAWAKQVMLGADHVVITASAGPRQSAQYQESRRSAQGHRARTTESRSWFSTRSACRSVPRSRSRISVMRSELEPKIVIDFDAQLFGTAANNGQMIEEVSDKSKAAEAVPQPRQSSDRRVRAEDRAPVTARPDPRPPKANQETRVTCSENGVRLRHRLHRRP